MVKYKKLYNWSNRKDAVIESDCFSTVTIKTFRIEYEAETWAFPIGVRWYSDKRYRQHRAVAISVFCIHFIFQKYVW